MRRVPRRDGSTRQPSRDPRQPQVLSDERGALAVRQRPRQRGRNACVEQAAPRPTRRLIDTRAELLVGEVVDGIRSRNLTHEALADERLERSHGLLVAPSAGMPHAVEVEGSANDRRGAEHLPRHVAQTGQPGVQETANLGRQHRPRLLISGMSRGEVFRHEQWSPSLSRYTRCSRSGAEGRGCAA